MQQKQHTIFGLHSVMTLLETHPERVMRLCLLQGRDDKKIEAIRQTAKAHGIAIENTTRQALDQMTDEANHQGVVAYCKPAKALTSTDMKEILQNTSKPPFVLVLDGVQDPHNLGACFRTADAAGVDLIIAPKDNSVGITPVVSKVACGAAESVPFIQVTNLVRALEELKELGIWIYGAAGEAEQSIFDTDLRGPIALVLGAEGAGLRRLTREHCDVLVKIPMHGVVSSLNVSVATGIFLFEAVRKRR